MLIYLLPPAGTPPRAVRGADPGAGGPRYRAIVKDPLPLVAVNHVMKTGSVTEMKATNGSGAVICARKREPPAGASPPLVALKTVMKTGSVTEMKATIGSDAVRCAR